MGAKRKTVGKNILEAMDSNLDDLKKPTVVAKPRREEDRRAAEVAVQRAPFQALIPKKTLEKARDAVYWTPGLTLASLTEMALQREIERLEKTRGGSFQPRKGELPTGRPVR